MRSFIALTIDLLAYVTCLQYQFPVHVVLVDMGSRHTDGVLEVRIRMNGKQAESKKVIVTHH